MSGIEIAGLVLGGLPIVLVALEKYRAAFEPLEEWWFFRRHLIEFVDSISHQLMLYRQNLVLMLDPLVPDANDLERLVEDAGDARWMDRSLEAGLRRRLHGEYDRYLRILGRMEETLRSLQRSLKVSDEGFLRAENRPLSLRHLQVAMSRAKYKKVAKFAKLNQELQDILGFSEKTIPISDIRKRSAPLAAIEEHRKRLCTVHDVIRSNWRCRCTHRHAHQIHVRLTTHIAAQSSHDRDTELLAVLFDDGYEPSAKKCSRQLILRSKEGPSEDNNMVGSLSLTDHSRIDEVVKISMEDNKTLGKFSMRRLLSAKSTQETKLQTQPNSAKVQRPSSQASKGQPTCRQSGQHRVDISGSGLVINDFCATLRGLAANSHCERVVHDEYGRRFSVTVKEPLADNSSALSPLADILSVNDTTVLALSRQNRFEIATLAATAILQLQVTPWLRSEWSSKDILVGTGPISIDTKQTFVRNHFLSVTNPVTVSSTEDWTQFREEETRQSLFNLGKVVLEMIFGIPFKACPFREQYYGPGGVPNDMTDVSAARKWSQLVLPECGDELAEAVRRCLDCSFGPKPDLNEKRFREAVFSGVVQPLMNYLKIWPNSLAQP